MLYKALTHPFIYVISVRCFTVIKVRKIIMKVQSIFIISLILSGCISNENLELYSDLYIKANTAAPVGSEVTTLKKEALRRCNSYDLEGVELNKCIDEQYDKLHSQHIEASKAERAITVQQ
jgi:hypothetical protein